MAFIPYFVELLLIPIAQRVKMMSYLSTTKKMHEALIRESAVKLYIFKIPWPILNDCKFLVAIANGVTT